MLTSLLAALLIGLASYRAWRVLAIDSITKSFRSYVLEWAEAGNRLADWVLRLIMCSWCLGFWYCGAGTLYVWLTTTELQAPVLVWLAASFVCGTIGKLMKD